MGLRRFAKAVVFAVSAFLVLPLAAASWIEKRLAAGEVVFTFCAQSLALVPGLPGSWLRAAFYGFTLDDCAWEVHIGFGSHFSHRGAVVGPQASMGSYCVIGHAHIGRRAMIGSRVSIPSGKRQHLDEGGRLSGSEGRFDTVTVGDGCWIGEGAILLADVGAGSIVSAGAVVVQPAPAGSLVGGNPARVLRALDPDQQG